MREAWGRACRRARRRTAINAAQTQPPPSDDVEALAALLASDQGGNEATLQATINIIAIVLAYLSVAFFVISDETKAIPIGVLLVLPAPVLLLQTLQMTWAAGVVGRASSAERIEKALVDSLSDTDLKERHRSGLLGARTTTRLTDIRLTGPAGAFAANAPYVGFYLLSAAFTIYALARAFGVAGTSATLRLLCVFGTGFYMAYLSAFAVAALRSFSIASSSDGTPMSLRLGWKGSRILGTAATFVAAIAVSLQVLQTEDPTSPWAYFTVWSAITTGTGWLLLDLGAGSRVARVVAAAGSIGCLLSAIVYWLVLYPLNGIGIQPLTVAANLTLHLLLPVVVIARLTLGEQTWRLDRHLSLATLLLPLAYVAVSLGPANGSQSPYTFLRPQENLLLFGIFCVVFVIVWIVAGRLWEIPLSGRAQGNAPHAAART